MSEITKESRAERAIACHNKAYNCAQSVAFAFLDKVWAAWKEPVVLFPQQLF